MSKNDAKVKWSLETKQDFESIKNVLTQAPVLTSPQFDKDFIIFYFASEHTIAVVLLQKDDQDNENPIAFFSRALRDAPLKYQITEKQAYALVKAIKYFRIYILYSHVIAYVPNSVVKDILTQEGLEGKRGKWIASILEYDIEIKPTKLIKGQGLAKLMFKTNFQALDINQLDNELELATPQINETFLQSPSYADIFFLLLNLCAPPGLSRTKKRFLRMKSSKFCVIDAALFWKNHEGKRKLLPLPLKPISTENPFQQWGLNFIREIHPSSSGQHKWILTATDYFTKWIEAIPCRQANESTIIQFLEGNILSRFGFPEKIITDNAVAFKYKKIINFCHKFHITLGHSITYYPQGNGLAESSNKSLFNIIKKLLEENKKNWHRKLTNDLWADRLSTKKSIRMSPYELVYGMEARFPSFFGIPTIKLLQEIQAEPNDMQRRVNQTIHLQKTREQVYDRAQMLQEKLKRMFDKKAKAEDFWVGRKVLRWDSRREDKGKHAKFDFLWKGPYIISVVQGNNTYFLKSLDGSTTEEGPVNGQMLKHYHDPF
eukprot:PITA_20569